MNASTPTDTAKGTPVGVPKSYKVLGTLFLVGSFFGMINGPAGLFVDRVTRIPYAGLVTGVMLGAMGALLHQVVLQDSPDKLKELKVGKLDVDEWAKEKFPKPLYQFLFEPNEFADNIRKKWGLDKTSDAQKGAAP